jgi:glycosyltransferase involved in cell wall biosynthesis
MRKHGLQVGINISQTGADRADRGWIADLLVRQMAKLAPDHEFFLYPPFGKRTNNDAGNGAHLESGNVLEPFHRLDPEEGWRVWRAVDSGKENWRGAPDIVHSFCSQAECVAPAKLVYTIYDLGFWIHPELTSEENRLLYQRGVLEAISRAVGIVFISQRSLDEFERVLPGLLEEKGVRHTVASLASRFASVNQSRTTMSSGDWLAVGSLEPRKNYERILSAFESYRENSSVKRRLTIAGSKGWKSEDLRKGIERLERQGLVKYEDCVDANQLRELYSSAFGLVFPSHYEGFALPIVEAMSQGCPVITGKNSSLPEFGGPAAIYCNDTDADISETMLRLERDEQYYLATSRAGLVQANRFSWSSAAGRVLELYHDVG